MEPQAETALATATALVCGTALSVTATELNLTGVRADDRAAFSALPELVNLRTLILSNIRFSDEGWGELMTALRKCPRLARLEMAGCGLGPKHAGDLADFFSSGCNINTLCLSKNDGITGKRSRDNDGQAPWIYGEEMEGWTALCSALPDTMISMDFSGCQLQPKSLALLNAAISKMAALTMACVIGNPIGSDGAKLLIEVFDSHPKLQSLCGISPGCTTVDLSNSNMGPADCRLPNSHS